MSKKEQLVEADELFNRLWALSEKSVAELLPLYDGLKVGDLELVLTFTALQLFKGPFPESEVYLASLRSFFDTFKYYLESYEKELKDDFDDVKFSMGPVNKIDS